MVTSASTLRPPVRRSRANREARTRFPAPSPLDKGAQWTANGAQGSTAWIPYKLGGLKLASWILVVRLLAGVTGLVRKT
jgi:hypothetical protein